MTHATDIVAYTFQADTYCPDCIGELVYHPNGDAAAAYPDGGAEAQLDWVADALGIDRGDEHTFDSGDFPKVVFSCQIEETEHCGQCGTEIT